MCVFKAILKASHFFIFYFGKAMIKPEKRGTEGWRGAGEGAEKRGQGRGVGGHDCNDMFLNNIWGLSNYGLACITHFLASHFFIKRKKERQPLYLITGEIIRYLGCWRISGVSWETTRHATAMQRDSYWLDIIFVVDCRLLRTRDTRNDQDALSRPVSHPTPIPPLLPLPRLTPTTTTT